MFSTPDDALTSNGEAKKGSITFLSESHLLSILEYTDFVDVVSGLTLALSVLEQKHECRRLLLHLNNDVTKLIYPNFLPCTPRHVTQ